jgi:hypothetical protein
MAKFEVCDAPQPARVDIAGDDEFLTGHETPARRHPQDAAGLFPFPRVDGMQILASISGLPCGMSVNLKTQPTHWTRSSILLFTSLPKVAA